MSNSEKTYLKSLFEIAVKQALPETCLPPYLDNIDVTDEVCVLGAGKAALQMAKVAEHRFGDKCYGAVVTRYGYSRVTNIGRLKVLQASHPLPDQGSVDAAYELLKLAKAVPADVPVLFLISGGGSALMCLPIEGLDLDEKIRVNKFLLASGASIHEINTVRKHLSQVKGGKLAQAVSGEFETFVISDVVGDDPGIIASGPTVAGHSTPTQAIEILERYDYPQLYKLRNLLLSQKNDIKPLESKSVTIIANAKRSIDKAIEFAKKDGWSTEVLSYEQEGEAKLVARQHAARAIKAVKEGRRVLLFSGGELTVTLNNSAGSGGPNQEYLLALAIELQGQRGVCALACDTDGVDGNKDVAGGFIDSSTLRRAEALSLDPIDMLKNNQSFDFFNALKDLIVTGPTHTNVNDFRVLMVSPS